MEAEISLAEDLLRSDQFAIQPVRTDDRCPVARQALDLAPQLPVVQLGDDHTLCAFHCLA